MQPKGNYQNTGPHARSHTVSASPCHTPGSPISLLVPPTFLLPVSVFVCLWWEVTVSLENETALVLCERLQTLEHPTLQPSYQLWGRVKGGVVSKGLLI